MSQIGFVEYKYLTHFSQPIHNRTIYRSINDHKFCRILEIGIGSGERALNMIAVAQRSSPDIEVRYTGIDLFEGRPSGTEGISLKDAHKLLHQTAAKVQLVPGDPYMALLRVANSLRDMDLIIVSADQDPDSLAAAWTYVPRMMYSGSMVMRERSTGSSGAIQLEALDIEVIERLAGNHGRRMAA